MRRQRDQSLPRGVTALKGHDGQIWFAVFSPDAQTGGEDRTIRLWSAGGAE